MIMGLHATIFRKRNSQRMVTIVIVRVTTSGNIAILMNQTITDQMVFVNCN
ncbi:hypothetical protein D3C86_1121220 [compost metagenome]